MELSINGLVIEADPEKTRQLYSGAKSVAESCSCIGCRNYALAADFFPGEVKELFGSLGIDPKKAAEVYLLTGKNEENAQYGGFYHLCGRITNGGRNENPIAFHRIAEGYFVGFTDDISLPEDDIPEPSLQMEIDFTVPWLTER